MGKRKALKNQGSEFRKDIIPCRRDDHHKRELNKAVLVKLLNGTHHFGLSATVVFLINSGYIFYLSGLQKDSTISAEYPLSV